MNWKLYKDCNPPEPGKYLVWFEECEFRDCYFDGDQWILVEFETVKYWCEVTAPEEYTQEPEF